jgi:inner membrane protein
MIFLTHLLGGILAAFYLGKFFGFGVVFVAVAAIFSALPDLDSVKSMLGRRAEPYSTVLSFIFRHRGFLHSFVFAAMVYVGMRLAFSANIASAAVIGYSSHLVLDAITKEGIMPFSPFSKFRIRGFIKTSGIFEYLVFAVMAVLLYLKL